jgi:sodium transport system permease protein
VNFRNISVVYRKEMRDLLRDKRTLRSMILVPLVFMPLMIQGTARLTQSVTAKAMSEVATVQIVGAADSPDIVGRLKGDPKLRIEPAAENWKELIADKKIRAAVRIPDHFDSDVRNGAGGQVTIFNYEGEIRSGFAASELDGFFRKLGDEIVRKRLESRGLPPALIKPFTTARENVAPPEKVAGNRVGGLVPYFIVILCFVGAIYPAIDLTAGEKERGTMETLLCSPLARTEIVLGKFLMVLSSALASVVMACVSMLLCFQLSGPKAAGGLAQLGLTHVDPAGVVGVLVLILPVAVLISAVLVTLGVWARNHREALTYMQPFMFLILVPAVIGMLPGIELNAGYALVPILNLALACREMLSGVWHWHYLVLIFVSLSVYAAIALSIAVRMFNRESVIFRT